MARLAGSVAVPHDFALEQQGAPETGFAPGSQPLAPRSDADTSCEDKPTGSVVREENTRGQYQYTVTYNEEKTGLSLSEEARPRSRSGAVCLSAHMLCSASPIARACSRADGF